MPSFWSPQGSAFTNNVDGTISIQSPAGWIYVGYDTSEQQITPELNATTITIKCTCVSGWCNPFYNTKSNVGGCMGVCTLCTMETMISNLGINVQTGGFINLSILPDIIGDNFGSIPGGFKAMYELPIVQNIIKNFLQSIFTTGPIPSLIYNPGRNAIEAPENCKIGLVNIAGRAVPLPIPSNIANPYCGLEASCNCGCELVEDTIPFVGTLYQCKDNCPGTCTLTIKNIAQWGQIEVMNIANFFAF